MMQSDKEQWYVAFTTPAVGCQLEPPESDEDVPGDGTASEQPADTPRVTVKVVAMEAECKGIMLQSRLMVSLYDGESSRSRIIHSGVVKLTSPQEVKTFARTVATHVARILHVPTSDGDDGEPTRAEIESRAAQYQQGLARFESKVREEGRRRHFADLAAKNRPPAAPTAEEMAALYEKAKGLAEADDLWDRIDKVLGSLIVGEVANRKLLYLVFSSRILDKPANAIVKGASSAGKSHLVLQVRRLFPDDAIYDLTAISPKFLLHFPYDLRHKHILLLEINGLGHEGLAASILRQLLSESRINYGTVAGGRGVIIPIPGPTGFVSTTVESELEHQLETRCLSPGIDDSPAQTRKVLISQAANSMGTNGPPPNLDQFVAFQEWLQKMPLLTVHIPYAPQIAEAMPDWMPRARRDYDAVMQLIRTSALIHQRQRNDVAPGVIEATEQDYRIAFEAMAEPLSQAETGLSPRDREVYEQLESLLKSKSSHGSNAPEPSATLTELARSATFGPDKAKITKQSMQPYVQRLIRLGYVENDGTRRQARLRIAEKLPGRAILPDPDVLFKKEAH